MCFLSPPVEFIGDVQIPNRGIRNRFRIRVHSLSNPGRTCRILKYLVRPSFAPFSHRATESRADVTRRHSPRDSHSTRTWQRVENLETARTRPWTQVDAHGDATERCSADCQVRLARGWPTTGCSGARSGCGRATAAASSTRPSGPGVRCATSRRRRRVTPWTRSSSNPRQVSTAAATRRTTRALGWSSPSRAFCRRLSGTTGR